MATPFISLLEPPNDLSSYNRHLPPSQQTSTSLPKVFLDAMEVREAVYAKEQGVPLEFEQDDDDNRAAHWVIYASVNQTIEPEIRDPSTNALIRPRRSESRSMPIGTLRLIPFPHPPHPRKGGIYVNDKLVNAGDPSPGSIPQDLSIIQPLTQTEKHRLSATPSFIPYAIDPPTTYHDGQEVYVKLGRLAVLKEFRGHGIATQLIRAAFEWMMRHKNGFNPSATADITTLGLNDPHSRNSTSSAARPGGAGLPRRVSVSSTGPSDVPKWKGLFCCHAQESAVKIWEKHGFQVDPAMGRWLEEGIPHVGMFYRAQLLR
ncbi:putative acyl n-acyltransferase [Rhypophila sp. PSN 637]